MEEGSSSGVQILQRLRKGEISDEELKKHIRVHWEKRLQWGYKPTFQEQLQSNLKFIKSLKEMEMSGEVELNIDELDEVSDYQKKKKAYELPSEYMGTMFGKTLKQSACYFKDESMTIDEAEEAAYELYCERAQIKDGQTVIDIGCGHGGLVLYIAQKYNNCHVTGLSNSATHVNYIQMQCKKLQLSNVDVILADITKYDTKKTWDRVMVVETTEAMDEDDWYPGYIYPKGSLTFLWSSTLLYFQEDVTVVDHWVLNGMHMARSMQEHMKKIEQNMEKMREILEQTVAGGSKEAVNQIVTHVRTFCIGAYETFSSNNGEELMMAHFLFKKKQ